MELQKSFPGLKIEGGAYTPPPKVQYGIRLVGAPCCPPFPPPCSEPLAAWQVRAAQVGAALFFFFGEQMYAALGRRPPALHGQMHENKFLTMGGASPLRPALQG